MPLSDIIDIQISTDSVAVSQAGFGIPLILSHSAAWVERIRFYEEPADVAVDFAVTTPEYLAAAAMFAQNPRPAQIAIGRAALVPTQRWNIAVASVANSTAYTIYVDGQTVTVTSDGSATNDEIVALFVTAVNALTTAVTASAIGSGGSQTLRIVADVAGAWFSVSIANPSLLTLSQDHADPGVATDLTAINNENSSWYALCTLFNSQAVVEAAAAWVESNKKLYVAACQDTASITAAAGGSDTVNELNEDSIARTAAIYHPDNGEFIDAALLGKCLPLDPGSETWKFKTLSGVSPVTLTATHKTNLEAKSCNYYYTVAGVNITAQGVVAAEEYIDVIRFRDWLEARMSERIFSRLAAVAKIPFTDLGAAVIEMEVRAQLTDGVAVGGLSSDPAPAVSVPKISTVSSANKLARNLPDVKFTATLAGAIHELVIRGNVSV